MTFEELRLVVVVYTTAIFPIIILFNMHLKDQLPRSILKIYLSSFLICALGWELWFTYGIYAGDPVDIRRSEILNQYIPKNINWLMNSLADAGTIFFRLRSYNISLAALAPGAAITPPPGWVLDPHM